VNNIRNIEELKKTLSEAETLATEYAIEMYSEAQRARYASEGRSLQVSKDR
jgi:hypothetical protein